MKNCILLLIFFFCVNFSFAQNSSRIFKEIRQVEKGLEIEVHDGSYKITFIDEKIIETTFTPINSALNRPSHAVVLKAKQVALEVFIGKNQSEFLSSGISVQIKHKPFQIIYQYKGKTLTSEKRGYYKSKHQGMDLVKETIIANETEKISFNLKPEEILYGTGARSLGMNRRGHRLALYNRADYGYETYSELMNFTLPLVISANKYMLHFDNAAIGYLDLDSKNSNTLTYETISGRKTYQVIAGDSWLDLIDTYTNLTGKQPLPPRWVLGNFSSRFGYHSQQEVVKTIAKFKEENIPVDAVILDLYWFGKAIKGTMGNLEVYKDSFPDLKGMISDFKKQGVKTILITEPFILAASNKWKEAVEKDILAKDTVGMPAKYDFYFGNTGIVDIYKKEGKNWFWDIYKNLREMGVAGVWGDLGEPEVLPSWVNFSGKKADEIHNVYGHDWAGLIFEGYQKEYPKERPFILMRAGAAGSQRYGMIPWSGDVNRAWGGLQSQPEIALQMGMQGFGFMHSDLGGFAGDYEDDQLYTRWLQYGVFQPIFRPHGQEVVSSEPIFKNPKTKKLAKEAIELRYKLLPYNYNLAFENNQKGSPLMRPIFFEEETERLLENASTYLWGHDFLITPILKDSVKTVEIYFPKTANWFNFYTDEKIEGGQTKSIATKAETIPTYIRGAAFIPMSKVVQTTDSYLANQLEIHYYYDASVRQSERQMYNDNGLLSNAYEKGAFEILTFESGTSKRYLKIDFSAELGGQWKPSEKEITLIIHNISWLPKKIKINSKRRAFTQSHQSIKIPFKWNPKKKLKIKIALNKKQ
jgi:alpha-glucosidase (family GH31 glycosyl hydrolase)